MRDKDLYQQILGIERPWAVTHVDVNRAAQEVVVKVSRDQRVALKCPVCAKRASGYDQRVRRWRHLDTCQFKTILEAEVPRVQCKEHGVHQDSVPWAEEGSRFTALFEALVINWLHEASVSGVASQVRLSWHEVSGILTAVVAGVTNAASESINGTIQQLKRRANGYRNRERFRMAIYFHLGGLDMYPRSLRSTHTKA